MPKPSPVAVSVAVSGKPDTKGRPVSQDSSGVATESVPPKQRRRFSAAYKLQILQQADACTEKGEVEALLRREGLYSSLLCSWRKELRLKGTEGLGSRRPGRKAKLSDKDRLILRLQDDKAKLQQQLDLAHKLLELQKKASELLCIPLLQLRSDEEC